MQSVYQIAATVRRINRKLATLIPSSELKWDNREGNYFLHIKSTNGEPDQVKGPVYHTDLLPFATYINLWKVHERQTERGLQTSHGVKMEGKLRSDLMVYLITAFEAAYYQTKRRGCAPEQTPFVPNSSVDHIDWDKEQPPDSDTPDEGMNYHEIEEAIADLMKV